MMPDLILATAVATPTGPLSLLAWAGRLVGGGFTAEPGQLQSRLHPSLRGLAWRAVPPGELPWLVKPVCDYFDGDLVALDRLAVLQPGSPGRQRLWAAMRAVPPGSTISYTGLAGRAGQPDAPRAAGAACAANLVAPVIPCHRILRTDGGLGGYYYGLDRKAWLLRHEGARPAGGPAS
jgi:methylated-DNA-[protein]-cysteine S-methyltransferase